MTIILKRLVLASQVASDEDFTLQIVARIQTNHHQYMASHVVISSQLNDKLTRTRKFVFRHHLRSCDLLYYSLS